ncbi:hypothetical protein [Acetobacter cerevisiae]|uniref:Uncharacterized protein n=1 Tax=Acetobacter cerevisiae TaxID=178900 RepID=A0A149Q947_9PROT|nr:hypothetical protein [Acetobacter cerevisiae]KXU93869.1 hypothetical protein AD928_07785 [Acetobacter cerevisiae]GBQ07174.1 hypothetical protein AA14362_1207 [Acetobacter cerevisiae DSM 14362]
MRRPFDTSRAGSGFLHGSRFSRGILNPRSKRAERPETEAAAQTSGTTASGNAGAAQGRTQEPDGASSEKTEKSPDETTDQCFA